MIVVYNSDERFAGIFATSVLSLFECNKEEEEITVYLIEKEISFESKERFQQIAKMYGRRIITLPMPDIEQLAGVGISIPGYNRMATCGRLFVSSLLPEEVDKALYVDCDTIFMESIRELWETDISQYSVGMVDCGQHSSLRKHLGLSPGGIYYNSGLLLMNLKRWREDHVERAFLDFINSQGGYIPFPDEGVINAVFDGKILRLPLRYNVYSQLYSFTYDELCYMRELTNFYSPEEAEMACKNPVMLHFTSNFYMSRRPWVRGCDHPYVRKYLEYKSMTPWKDEPLWEDTRPGINRVYTKYCHIAPRPVVMWTSRIIVVYLRPVMYRYKRWRNMKMNRIGLNTSRGIS